MPIEKRIVNGKITDVWYRATKVRASGPCIECKSAHVRYREPHGKRCNACRKKMGIIP